MKRPYTDRPLRFLFAILCAALIILPVSADTLKTLSIDGHVYELVLTENTELTGKLTFRQDRQLSGTHYRGQLKDFPDSWVRASQVDGNWQGVVSINGERYILDQPTGNNPALPDRVAEARIGDLSATPVSNFEPRACGVKTSSSLVAAAAHVAEPASALVVAKEVAFSSLCANTINGTCLIAELEVAFDADFVASFADNGIAADQALALINAVEGFYLNDFDISFEALSLELLNNNVSATTDANDLLTDISAAKDSGTFGFLQNNRALFHFITGRDLNGGTAGIGFVNEICTTNAVGITSLLSNFGGAPNIPLTATIMAHELGHNLGADHDVDTNACGSGFIMEASVNSATSQFSSCSITEIIDAVEDVANPALCFNFPADAGITASAGNPSQVTNNEEFTSSYTITSSNSFQAIPTLLVNGSIAPSQGQFTSVTLSGQNCSLGGQAETYTCSLGSPAPAVNLVINAIATGASFTITHSTAVAGSSDIRDVDSSNDQLVVAYAVVMGAPPAAPSGLVGAQGNGENVNLTWQDNSDNETGFILERRTLGGTFAELAQPGINANSFTDISSVAGNTYEYRVSATNANGSSVPGALAQVTVTMPVGQPPTAPTGLVAEQGSNTEVNLSWLDNSNNEINFIVQRRLLGGTFADLIQLGANITSFVDNTSTATNTYEYQVFARNADGPSGATAVAQVEVTPAVVNPPPTSDGGGGGGSIHWSLLLCLAGFAWRRQLESRKLAS